MAARKKAPAAPSLFDVPVPSVPTAPISQVQVSQPLEPTWSPPVKEARSIGSACPKCRGCGGDPTKHDAIKWPLHWTRYECPHPGCGKVWNSAEVKRQIRERLE